MRLTFLRLVIQQCKWVLLSLSLLTLTAHAQSDLSGVIDIHLHLDPDSTPRLIDSDDMARIAKEHGMRGLVLKNHYESTAAIAYEVRKVVPGIEIFGGIVLNLAVGGINPSAVSRMALMKGGWGKVVWMPTFDSENQVKFSKENRPFVAVSKDGHLLPEVEQVIDIIAKNQMTLETGHISAEEGLLLIREARRRGVQHIVVTHPILEEIRMTIPQMQEAAGEGAYLEFTYGAFYLPNPTVTMADYVKAIRAVGPNSCILATDLGEKGRPLPTDGMASFFDGLRKQGFSQAEIDLMSKTNPARALGLQ